MTRLLLDVLAEAVDEGDMLVDPYDTAGRWRIVEKRVLTDAFPMWANGVPLDVCAWLVEPACRDTPLRVLLRANDEVVTVEVRTKGTDNAEHSREDAGERDQGGARPA